MAVAARRVGRVEGRPASELVPPPLRGGGFIEHNPSFDVKRLKKHTDRLGAAHFVSARRQYPLELHRCPFFHLPQPCSRVTACPFFRNACLRRPRQPLLLRISPMPVVVAEMVRAKISLLLGGEFGSRASTSRTRTTHRPTSHGPFPPQLLSDRRWPYGR